MLLKNRIDRSGSMSGSRVEAAKSAGKMFVDFMRLYDKVGVVGFSSAASVAYPLTQIDESGYVVPGRKCQIFRILPFFWEGKAW